jgi:hypothetical protein
MARRVFYSFHYLPDSWRASQVRNIGVVEGNKPATDNDWETVKKGGDAAIQKDTAKRKWIDYEIHTSWNSNKGVVGIYIHNLKDWAQKQTTKGANPFVHITMKRDGKSLSSIVKAYDPPYSDSAQAYKYISDNLSTWIEEAVRIRENY